MMRLLTAQAVIAERTLQLRVQVRSFEAVCRMVQADFGVGTLPYEAAKIIGQSMGLVVRPLEEDWAERNMLLCVKKERAGNSALIKLVEHLRA
jgi:DNA-binding transcriptional LysR family regulator